MPFFDENALPKNAILLPPYKKSTQKSLKIDVIKTGPHRILLYSLVVFSLGRPGWAASGTESASFLDIPVGAAPASLGGAYSALATDAYAPTYNAGGLGFLSGSQLSGQHLSYLQSIYYEYASFAFPLASSSRSFGGLGASLQYFSPGDIAGADENGDPTGRFSGHYASYALSYGFPVTDRWGIGATGKIVQAKIADVTGAAYATDIGTLFNIRPHWSAAATMTNLGTRLTFLRDGQPLPTTYHVGTAYAATSRWLLTLEGAFPTRGAASFHGGGQWRPFDKVAIRAGYRTDTLEETSVLAGLSVGAGLHFWGQDLAYAWLPYGELGDTQYFSFLFRFGRRDADDSPTLKRHAGMAL